MGAEGTPGVPLDLVVSIDEPFGSGLTGLGG
jgi:hypothetical protein